MLEAPVFTILGSGFGMYGYLPALIECGMRVALPERYRTVVAERSELSQYMPQIIWCESMDGALEQAYGAVVALRPADQAAWIPRLARMPNLRDLILEKPVAPSPQMAAELLEVLDRFGKRYRVGYTFRFLPWAKLLRSALAERPERVSVNWSFLAHHYRANLQNWKRFDVSGGGALRFYGIHLIALLAELGYGDVLTSAASGPSDAETAEWEATFGGEALCPFGLKIDTRASEPSFTITVRRRDREDECIVEQSDPFSSIRPSISNGRDPRVDVLGRLCHSFDEADMPNAKRQQAIIGLWAGVEKKSERR
ncbi:hypothetical protein [Bradyrhizobium sp. 187]|uniref:hypothetical protein n=1 Tax=Bradyrhizobium sp. 187 TaxID=2782655 RepID=UPI00200007DA|nr:hypothetical protein [Bradyrhizobium sp. 187]UPJ70878.1 hypothetical protein IVB19_24780 [Bradyrhizobium sp. 187]